MPLEVIVNGKSATIRPSAVPSTNKYNDPVNTFAVDKNFYVLSEKAGDL
jgi:hypothetical protein